MEVRFESSLDVIKRRVVGKDDIGKAAMFLFGTKHEDGPNTVKPSGDFQSGFDITDSICDELKRDLEKALDETMADLRVEYLAQSHSARVHAKALRC